jgi:hypothetical protein
VRCAAEAKTPITIGAAISALATAISVTAGVPLLNLCAMESDCRNCPDRTPFCHIECDSYKTYCADNKADKAAKKAYLDKHNAPNGVLINGYIRRKKKTRLFNGKRVK